MMHIVAIYDTHCCIFVLRYIVTPLVFNVDNSNNNVFLRDKSIY